MYKVYIEQIFIYRILIYGTASKTDLQKSHSTEKKFHLSSSILDESCSNATGALLMELCKFLNRLNGFFSKLIHWKSVDKQCQKHFRGKDVCYLLAQTNRDQGVSFISHVSDKMF